MVVNSCCDFQIVTPNAYIFMYAIQRQFNQDQAKSYKGFKQQREEKKAIKKLVKHLKF